MHVSHLVDDALKYTGQSDHRVGTATVRRLLLLLLDEYGVMVNLLNASGANMHQVLMLTENFGIERVNRLCTYETGRLLQDF